MTGVLLIYFSLTFLLKKALKKYPYLPPFTHTPPLPPTYTSFTPHLHPTYLPFLPLTSHNTHPSPQIPPNNHAHMSNFFLIDTMVELVVGWSVINGAYPF